MPVLAPGPELVPVLGLGPVAGHPPKYRTLLFSGRGLPAAVAAVDVVESVVAVVVIVPVPFFGVQPRHRGPYLNGRGLRYPEQTHCRGHSAETRRRTDSRDSLEDCWPGRVPLRIVALFSSDPPGKKEIRKS